MKEEEKKRVAKAKERKNKITNGWNCAVHTNSSRPRLAGVVAPPVAAT